MKSPMKIAALDLGSNSFLCLMVEASEQGISRVHKDLVEIVRLGKDINKTKMIAADSLERARNCLENFKKEMDVFKPDLILAYATSAARDAKNSEDFFRIGKDLGIPIEIVSGDKEALTTYRGVFWGDKTSAAKVSSTNLLIDIGGGSTEVIIGKDMSLKKAISIDIGAVRLTEKWISRYPVSPVELSNLEKNVFHEVSTKLNWIKENPPQKVLAVAGTPTTLAAAELGGYDAEKIEGYSFTVEDLELWKKKLAESTLDEIVNNHGIPKGRADIILSGVIILKTIIDVYHLNLVKVSTRGVRYGIVANYFLNNKG